MAAAPGTTTATTGATTDAEGVLCCQPRAPLEDLEEEVDEMVSQLSAPSLYSRVTSTPGGRAQTAAVAHAQGGRMQQWIAGDLLGSAEDVERRRIAEMSTAHRSTTSSEVQYIDHPRPLQNDAIANMAMTVRAGERMGSRHGVQRHELPPQWRHRRELPPSAAAGPAVAGLAAMAGDETVAEAEPASAVATAAAAAVAAGSPPTTRRPLAPLDKNSAAVQRSAPGQQGGSASELALLQLGTCEEPQLVDMIEALLVAHPELAPEVRQMLVPER